MITVKEIKESKTDKQWHRLYNAYIKNYNKLSEKLDGSVYDSMSFVEYKDTYANLYVGGIRQNITRTIVAKEAIVSTAQARVAADVLFNMAIEATKQEHETGYITDAQQAIISLFKQYAGSRTKMKNAIRKQPSIRDFLGEATQSEGKTWTEYIPSP